MRWDGNRWNFVAMAAWLGAVIVLLAFLDLKHKNSVVSAALWTGFGNRMVRFDRDITTQELDLVIQEHLKNLDRLIEEIGWFVEAHEQKKT